MWFSVFKNWTALLGFHVHAPLSAVLKSYRPQTITLFLRLSSIHIYFYVQIGFFTELLLSPANRPMADLEKNVPRHPPCLQKCIFFLSFYVGKVFGSWLTKWYNIISNIFWIITLIVILGIISIWTHFFIFLDKCIINDDLSLFVKLAWVKSQQRCYKW